MEEWPVLKHGEWTETKTYIIFCIALKMLQEGIG